MKTFKKEVLDEIIYVDREKTVPLIIKQSEPNSTVRFFLEYVIDQPGKTENNRKRMQMIDKIYGKFHGSTEDVSLEDAEHEFLKSHVDEVLAKVQPIVYGVISKVIDGAE